MKVRVDTLRLFKLVYKISPDITTIASLVQYLLLNDLYLSKENLKHFKKSGQLGNWERLPF